MAKHPASGRRKNPDPESYILVKTKEGEFYRRRRRKGTRLNDACQKSADDTKKSSPAAKRLRLCLAESFRGLSLGRPNAKFSSLLKQAADKNGRFDFSFFAGHDFQKEHPMDSLLLNPHQLRMKDGEAVVTIELDEDTVKRKNGLVTHYFFDLVLVWGDPGREGSLRVDSATSPLYAFGTEGKQYCELSLYLPDGKDPWMLMLKISCLEGNQMAVSGRNYGMKVIAVG